MDKDAGLYTSKDRQTFGGIKNEVLFSGIDDEGELFKNRYHRVVAKLVSENGRRKR